MNDNDCHGLADFHSPVSLSAFLISLFLLTLIFCPGETWPDLLLPLGYKVK